MKKKICLMLTLGSYINRVYWIKLYSPKIILYYAAGILHTTIFKTLNRLLKINLLSVWHIFIYIYILHKIKKFLITKFLYWCSLKLWIACSQEVILSQSPWAGRIWINHLEMKCNVKFMGNKPVHLILSWQHTGILFLNFWISFI